jgi:signal transduction histidine kinase
MQHKKSFVKNSAYHSNRNALIRFSLLLLAFLVICDMVFIFQQRESSIQASRHHLAQKLSLASEFCVEALLKNDFASIEHFLNAWTQEHQKIIALRASTKNGFRLIDYKKANASTHSMSLKKTTIYDGAPILTLEVNEDLTQLYSDLYKRAATLVAISSFTVAIFGFLLWRSIYHNAITPLQEEIQERIAIEEQLEKRTHALELSNQELEAFSYSVSHDLRAPLRAMDGYSAALLDDYAEQLDDQGKHYLERIRIGSQNMAALIDDLLSLSQVSRHDINLEDVDLSSLMRGIANTLQASDNGRNVQVTIEDNIHALGDKKLLQIALYNLMDNAWKYTNKQPTAAIQFGVQRQDAMPVYFIKDNGVGFNIQYQDKLFEPFQRLHRHDDFPGSGIGLAIVRRVIQCHGGRIWAEAKPGEGATFYFTLTKSPNLPQPTKPTQYANPSLH